MTPGRNYQLNEKISGYLAEQAKRLVNLMPGLDDAFRMFYGMETRGTQPWQKAIFSGDTHTNTRTSFMIVQPDETRI